MTDKSQKRIATLLVILGYVIFAYFSGEIMKAVLFILAIVTIVRIWRKKETKSKKEDAHK